MMMMNEQPQVEVNQIDGKEFFVKVFCEHKAGGFVRLMEALDSIGLEVKNANITSFRSLVSSIFTVEVFPIPLDRYIIRKSCINIYI